MSPEGTAQIREQIASAYEHLEAAQSAVKVVMREAREGLPEDAAIQALAEAGQWDGFIVSALAGLHACLDGLAAAD